jgi:hypothetical protein
MVEAVLDPCAYYDEDPNPEISQLCVQLIRLLDQRELGQDQKYELVDCRMKRSLLDLVSGDSWPSAKITKRYRPTQACAYLLDERGRMCTIRDGDASSLCQIAIPLAYDGNLHVKYIPAGRDSDSHYKLGSAMQPTRVLDSYPDSSLDRSDIADDLKDALRAFAWHLP